MQTILLTGFGPFREHKVNPSQVIAERLDGKRINGAVIKSLVLPVRFGDDTAILLPAIRDLKPAMVISLGLNAGIDAIHLEMFAVNHRCDSFGADHTPIVDGAQAAYFATIDVDRIVRGARDRSVIPVRSHGYAGSYLCNHIMYQSLHFATCEPIDTRIGFVHIPLASEYVDASAASKLPSFPLDLILDSVRIILEEAITLPSESH